MWFVGGKCHFGTWTWQTFNGKRYSNMITKFLRHELDDLALNDMGFPKNVISCRSPRDRMILLGKKLNDCNLQKYPSIWVMVSHWLAINHNLSVILFPDIIRIIGEIRANSFEKATRTCSSRTELKPIYLKSFLKMSWFVLMSFIIFLLLEIKKATTFQVTL